MIIDEKGKLFGKVSIIDIAIILVIIISIIGSVVVYKNIEQGKIAPSESALINHSESLGKACVEFELSSVREMTKQFLSVGDKVYSAETDKFIGEIINIDSKPYKDTITGADGTMVFAPVPEKYTLTLSVKVSGQQTENGFYSVENTHFAVGDSMPIKTEAVETTPTIKSVYMITE
ncbi:MAG: DUF4330 domain-containing protein [Ruminococcaceae bacterium]|nr:DUF4330 domain-containing protein [Oscillospiraceae bacterium]